MFILNQINTKYKLTNLIMINVKVIRLTLYNKYKIK